MKIAMEPEEDHLDPMPASLPPSGDNIATEFTRTRELSDADDTSGPALALALIQDAIAKRATDIHVDSCGDQYQVRFRIDGSLVAAIVADEHEGRRLINQFKVLTNVDPNEVNATETRWSGAIDGQTADLRCTIVPTIDGEKLCIRLFSRHATKLGLDDLFQCDEKQAQIRDWLQAGTGMMVVVGPTGSGKTTLLYALMDQLDLLACNVISLEDPVERREPNITQIEVHDAQHEVSFSDAVKLSLRLDPDYLVIGEARDAETASAAVSSANSGRILFSSMHGEDLGSVIENLRNWGITDREIASALRGVVSTRLVRQLCEDCKTTRDVSDDDRKWLEANSEPSWKQSSQPVGCPTCLGTGFLGMVPLHRVWNLSKEDRNRIAQSESGHDIAPTDASFREAGIALLRSGETSVSELRRAGLPQT